VNLATILRNLALFDLGAKPTTKAGWLIRLAVTFVALFFALRRTNALVAPLLTARPPAPIPSEEIDDYKFKLPERTRREIFMELAVAEVAERKRALAANSWASPQFPNGHLWSREDDRGHYERVKVRELAAKYRVSLSQVYLVLDEGIRARWPGPDGEPLPATTPPWNARTTW
jgi:hypothetical protein